LILAGDLNFTTSADEVWGPAAHMDRHAGYFLNMIKDHSLVDLALDILIPTWRNGRAGDTGIAKRLDRILVSESLLQEVGCYHSWVEIPYIYDHAAVINSIGFQTGSGSLSVQTKSYVATRD
jgi:endonuclease/exonuclease/phosphatase family metal-dependent hydrolase